MIGRPDGQGHREVLRVVPRSAGSPRRQIVYHFSILLAETDRQAENRLEALKAGGLGNGAWTRALQ